jgi:DNA polymerase III subunit epsilon
MDKRMQNLDLAIVDLETTGGNSTHHRIIEVAVLRVKEGAIVDSFSSLIDPERSIPPFIEHLTGITNESLRGAPTFSQVKDRVFEMVNGPIFVAHNARFDYNFLRDEFEREDMAFSARCLCTVRLSRLLFPEQRRHSLDSIIDRHGISCVDRHRAMGDVRVLWDFLNVVKERFDEEQIQGALATILKGPALPPMLNETALSSLPESPGAYIFYDQKRKPLYVGKSANIRSRVLSHFSGSHLSAKGSALAMEVAGVEVMKTAGELGALLMESHLIKKLHPVYNRRSRFRKRLFAVRKVRRDEGYSSTVIEHLDKVAPPDLPGVVALFSSLKSAKQFLWQTAKERSLCPKVMGLDPGEGPCFYRQPKACEGACAGVEKPAVYNLKFEKAFSARKIRLWPFSGPILIEEHGRKGGRGEIFVVDNWCLVDSFRFDEIGKQPFLPGDHAFDYDAYKIIVDYLFHRKPLVSFREIDREELERIRGF